MAKPHSIICFGEALWDCTPKGIFLGGAPTNVAYHLNRLGSRVALVTAVGDDFLGQELKRRISALGLDLSTLATVKPAMTGVVIVDLTDPSNPHYDIVDNSAWDFIPPSDILLETARAADAIVFGSLALRHDANRELLDTLLSLSSGIKVFDINLRPPYYTLDLIQEMAIRADIVKVNEAELRLITQNHDLSLPQLAAKYSLSVNAKVCVTCGAKGAGFLDGGEWFWCDALPIGQVGDSVGAGDSFLAGLVHSLVDELPAQTALTRGCRLAELVAQSDGATPDYDPTSFLSIGAVLPPI